MLDGRWETQKPMRPTPLLAASRCEATPAFASDVRPLDQAALTLLELLRFPSPVQRLPSLQPHLDAALGHVPLGLGNGVFTKVEDAGRQHCVGQTFGDTFHQMIEIAHTT